jgi:RNA polymerase sigma-70 factor (ECF subfamily)
MCEDDDWVERLRPEHAEREVAIAELRAILLRGLSKSLNNRYGKPFSAEDIVQDALIRILDSLDQFQGKSKFITWAMTIATRIGIRSLRRKYHEDMSLDAFSADDGVRIDVAVSENSLHDEAEKSKLLDVLQHLIEDALTEKQRLVVQSFLAGYSTDGIAQQTGTNRNAIYKLLHDAEVKLKTGFAEAGFSADDVAMALA